jgi:hypothetical protein
MSIALFSIQALELEVAAVRWWAISLALEIQEDQRANDRDEVDWQEHQVVDNVVWRKFLGWPFDLLPESVPKGSATFQLSSVGDEVD